MSRKVVRLTVDHLAQLEGPCRTCLFWQLDPVSRDRVATEEAATEKEAWVSQVLRDWGSCGRVVLVDDQPVGYADLRARRVRARARARSRPRRSPRTRCCSPTSGCTREHAGGGLGRMLVQGMARDLIKRGGIKAVEAFGDTRGPGRRGSCVVPSDFLGSVGFKTQRAHGATPRMRMDLRAALSLKDEVEAALERLVGAVRPAKAHPAEGRMTRSRPELSVETTAEKAETRPRAWSGLDGWPRGQAQAM